VRSPAVKHPKRRRVCPDPSAVSLPRVPRYIGSPEHKDYAIGGWRRPTPRPDATLCPKLDLELVSAWLTKALSDGTFSDLLEGGFPRYAWIEVQDQWFEARLTNQVLGEYKGYPIRHEELPIELRRSK